MDIWTVLLSIVICILGVYYLFKNFNYFKRHNVISMPSIPILGVMTSLCFGRMSVSEFLLMVYNYRRDAKYYGMYAMTQPVVLMRDPQLMKEVLIKDFETFHNRRPFSDVENDLMIRKNMFSLQSQKWRDIRTLLTPAFTAGKMKIMFTLMTECAVNFFSSLAPLVSMNGDVDVKSQIMKYTNDIITTCAFGIKMDTVKNPNNEFFINGILGTRFLEFRSVTLINLRTFWLGKLLKLRLVSEEVTNFFIGVLKNIVTTREAQNITRPDMIQLMMDARNNRLVAGKEIDIVDMTAQAFLFYFGGFETISTALAFGVHELAHNLDVQTKLRQEIDQILVESSGNIGYDTLGKLEYLDVVVKEILRMYPPLSFLERVCCKDQYKLPPAAPGEKPFVVKNGMVFWFPIFAIHRDDKYYDEPNQFRPERFLGNDTYENSTCYMPFGVGPRMCIAKRFAIQEMKLFLFHLFARYEVKACTKTSKQLASKGLQMTLENGFWLNMQCRGDMHLSIASTMPNLSENGMVDT